MVVSQKKIPAHLGSAKRLIDHIAAERMGLLNSREWKADWAERWVAFADLIAFASRAIRSDAVVLNNIVRFDRAAQIIGSEFPHVRTHRFSDATFAIADNFHDAFAYAVGLSHACLAFNQEFLNRASKPFFIHLTVPRITIARGSVLLPQLNTKEPRFTGLKVENILAGSAIVKAYRLEAHSAGGLITIASDELSVLQGVAVHGGNGRVRQGLRHWTERVQNPSHRKSGQVHCFRGSYVDIPWLLLRPIQNEAGRLWAADPDDADYAINAFLEMWDTSIREYYSPQDCGAPLTVAKHYQAAIRHGIHCYQICHGGIKPWYQTPAEVRESLRSVR